MSGINGKTLASCFEMVSRCGTELEGLRDTLSNMLEAALANASSVAMPCVISDDGIWDERMDDSGWVYTDIGFSLPLKKKGKGNKSTERYLGFQISMVGDGIAIPENSEPLLHVFFWSVPCSFEDDEYVGFPYSEGQDYPFEVMGNRLLMWEDKDSDGWTRHEWTYSLRLMDLNSADDLRKQVVEPALALIKGATPAEALHDGVRGLVRYPAKDLLVQA